MNPRSPSDTAALIPSPTNRPRLPYLGGLDGLRALAILAVLLYHSDLDVMRGGYLGVEVFFVISGYLITGLLFSEWNRRGSIDLKQFWVRRARRLFPALLVAIASALAVTVLFLPDQVAGLRGDALAALGYVANWHLIFSHESYFETAGRPSLLRHLWSLAIEEQFYLIFPPLLLLLLRYLGSRRATIVLAAAALASVGVMAWLYQPDGDPSRAYYGTDTRAAALLTGAVLAFIWTPWQGASRRRTANALDLLGFSALAGVLTACVLLDEFQPFLYRGGFTIVTLATALLVAAVVYPGTRLSRVMSHPLLGWIGLRSYGLYVWHWLVFDLTRPRLDVPWEGVPVFVLRMVITLAIVELSFRYLEQPIRHGALERGFSELRRAQGKRRTRLIAQWAISVGTVGSLVVLLGIAVAGARPPAPPPYLAMQSITVTADLTPEPEPVSPTQPPATATTDVTPPPVTTTAIATLPPATLTAVATLPPATLTAVATPPLTTTTAPHLTIVPSGTVTVTVRAAVTATARDVHGVRISAIGDSVMMGAAFELTRTLGTLDLDAAEGRQVSNAIQIVQSRKAMASLGQVVVLHLGNNGAFSASQFNTLMTLLADVQRVVILNNRIPRAWEAKNNETIANAASGFSNVVLVDWYAISAEHPEYFWNDGIHLRPEGARAYAELIALNAVLP